jgi:putative transposase
LVSDPRDYPWSSYAHYACGEVNRHVIAHDLYVKLGTTPAERQRAFADHCRQAIDDSEIDSFRTHLNKGLPLGSAAFLGRIEGLVGRAVFPPRRGRPTKTGVDSSSSGVIQAEKLL